MIQAGALPKAKLFNVSADTPGGLAVHIHQRGAARSPAESLQRQSAASRKKVQNRRIRHIGLDNAEQRFLHPVLCGARILSLWCKKLRAALAAKASVPAYVVFTDTTLRDMCAKMPTDEQELLQVSGVGERKAHRYGKAFLEEINRKAEEE